MAEDHLICNRCSREIEDKKSGHEIKRSFGEIEMLCEVCYDSRSDCYDCRGTGIGYGGPDTKCGYCRGRGRI